MGGHNVVQVSCLPRRQACPYPMVSASGCVLPSGDVPSKTAVRTWRTLCLDRGWEGDRGHEGLSDYGGILNS